MKHNTKITIFTERPDQKPSSNMTMAIKSLLFAAFISVSTIVWHAVAERHALRSHVESASGDGPIPNFRGL
jgi:hypothetical protein